MNTVDDLKITITVLTLTSQNSPIYSTYKSSHILCRIKLILLQMNVLQL